MKGSIGELVIAADIMKCGYSVFSELGDLSRTDLIAETSAGIIRIQVKSVISRNGERAELYLKKSGPSYQFKYCISDVDCFALYVLDLGLIAYVPSSILNKYSSLMTFRIKGSHNNQVERTNDIHEYRSFDEIVRGHTCGA